MKFFLVIALYYRSRGHYFTHKWVFRFKYTKAGQVIVRTQVSYANFIFDCINTFSN